MTQNDEKESHDCSQPRDKSRDRSDWSGTLDAFLREFVCRAGEGIALMCLAEASPAPDDATLDALIAERSARKLGAHESASDSHPLMPPFSFDVSRKACQQIIFRPASPTGSQSRHTHW